MYILCCDLVEGFIVALTDAQQRANKKYREKFEYLQARVTAEEKESVLMHVTAQGESINNFLRRAISETMERDKAKQQEE